MPNQVKIFALGGLDENGKNMYIVEVNNDIYVFEAGMKFPESSMPGIDMIIPDVGYLIKNKDRVRAYFISHGHDDIMGALGYVIADVPAPIYCSWATKMFVEDAAKRFGLKPNFDFVVVKTGDEVPFGNHKAIFFGTSHSASFSLGIALDTGQGYVVYTGDFIIDYGAPINYSTDVKTIAKIGEKEILCLMAESVDCDRPGHTSPNHKIAPIVDSILSKNSGRIIATFYSQNVFNIREFLDISKKYNRKVLFFDKEMQRIFYRSMDQGTFSIPQSLVLAHEDLTRPGNEDAVVIVSGIGEKLLHIVERLASGETVNNLTIKESDTIIVASPTIPGLEITFTKSIDALYRTGANIVNIKRKDVSSMHAHTEDIKMILTLLKPKYYMPVKGDFRHLVFNAQIAVDMNAGYNHSNTLVYDNGMVALFEDGVYKGNEAQIEVGEVMIDGLGVGDVGSYVLNDRAKLADNGVLILGITVDMKTKEVIAGPDVQQRGLFYVKDSERVLSEITKIFLEMVQDQMKDNSIQNEDAMNKIRDRLSMHIRRTTGKDPLIMPVVVRI